MSYSLGKLNAAREAIRQGDKETANRCIDELISRMEKLLKERAYWTAVAKGERNDYS